MDYKIVTYHMKDGTPELFEDDVLDLLEKGYTPQGGVAIDSKGNLYQAMVRNGNEVLEK